MKTVNLFILALWGISSALAGETNSAAASGTAPKLVVGIVVDQMRYDFIYRYWSKFGEGGFKRLVKQGTFYRNAQYNYVPTYTGPGHASIFTGATPSGHGIAANDWWDRKWGKIYCVSDTNFTTLGATSAKAGQMSPARLVATTVTDELKLAQPRSKVIGISLKDRAAILPAGHLADGAYWMDDQSGHWITSSYYTNATHLWPIPWVEKYAETNLPAGYFTNPWVRRFPQEDSVAGNFGAKFLPGESAQTTNHDLPGLFAQATNDKKYGLLRLVPAGNTEARKFAQTAIEGEQLGKRGGTDFLTLNFASTDYVGHRFGPRSWETEDTYVQFDQDLEQFLGFLESWVGMNQVLVFLTADHGVADVPAYSERNRLPGGTFTSSNIVQIQLNDYLETTFGSRLIKYYINQQIYLDTKFIELTGMDKARVESAIREWLLQKPGVAEVFSSSELRKEGGGGTIRGAIARGLYPSRSGDLTILLQSGWLDEAEGDSNTATSHGTPYQYDTHVPILFWGWKIPHLISDEPVTITQIAPTVCQMLNLQFPSLSDNRVLPGLGLPQLPSNHAENP